MWVKPQLMVQVHWLGLLYDLGKKVLKTNIFMGSLKSLNTETLYLHEPYYFPSVCPRYYQFKLQANA